MGLVGYIARKIIGTQSERILRGIRPIVAQVSALEPQMQSLSAEGLKGKTDEFRSRLAKGEVLDAILPEAFAAVREAARRTINMRHFDVQIMGGVVLHRGMIAEMATGEGKTLVATLAAYLNALAGKGVHIVTVNDYLARRDRDWMGPVYEYLGLTVGAIQHDMDPETRRRAYQSDITYGTNNEFGFDYLRDNMVIRASDRVQRPLYYGIVDEVDSILVDEARTPLIISGPAEESTEKYYTIDRVVRRLAQAEDYEFSEKDHTVNLTEQGIKRAEEALGIENLYDDRHVDLVHHITQALRAHTLYKRDDEYVVKDGQVIIVDEFTGRLMPGRRFSEGLHQALEAKEGVTIERENQTLATITFQNYFRMYKKLAGMTGTAETEAQEFHEIYKLEVVVTPTNRPLVRTNYPDVVYRTEAEKFRAVVREIAELHQAGRPVLVGTISIEKSERLSSLLRSQGIVHSVLNAKYHEQEAEIIARAGARAAVTIATNMAGRGTDIVLGDGVAGLGGLHVLGTERHEARRIDNQLRGRSGRQGDPGSSRFYLSLEDDLMRIFGSDRISGLMQRLGMEEDVPIDHPLVTKAIETAQRRVENRNFDIRKHLLEYDDVMNRQREIIYKERNSFLDGQGVRERTREMMEEVVEEVVLRHADPDLRRDDWDLVGLGHWLEHRLGTLFDVKVLEGKTAEEIYDTSIAAALKTYEEKETGLGPERLRFLEQVVALQIIDTRWKEHLYAMDCLREGIGLRAWGQRNPLTEFKHEGFQMFDTMISNVKSQVVELILKIKSVHEEEPRPMLRPAPREFVHPEAERMGGGTARNGSSALKAGPPQTRTVRNPVAKVGRNEPCPCGSGRKYKKCHGR
ncbi:MAG: preprotein translocase subunit SecA [Candidatus Omnitrophica bacterium]|nr:preprotein translocase subunit SecA [Candidatus Omnitrophota bacterium]